MEKEVITALDKQVVQLEARIAVLEELLFETNKPSVKYAVDPMGDTLVFNFSELTAADSKKIAQTIVAQEEEENEITEEALLLMIHSASQSDMAARFKPRT